jgi:hypothetical protein
MLFAPFAYDVVQVLSIMYMGKSVVTSENKLLSFLFAFVVAGPLDDEVLLFAAHEP